MALVICEKHGTKGGAKVSKLLYDEFKKGRDISGRVMDFSFIMEDIEWPFYGLEEEIEQIPEACVNGEFIIQCEERLNDALGRITVICMSCLKEAMNGAALPVKEGGA